jgi:hypothetical protein
MMGNWDLARSADKGVSLIDDGVSSAHLDFLGYARALNSLP